MAQPATLKVFENLRKGFDEKQATLITDAIEEEVASALKALSRNNMNDLEAQACAEFEARGASIA